MSASYTNTRAESKWPRYPAVYEINTWVWLSDLSRKYGKSVDLASVPSAEWDAISAYGFDAVWLMGVWERSPAGIAIANKNEGLLADFKRALPDFHSDDNAGSPYCVRRYVVDQHLGGSEALATAREELAKRGMNLLLDFVPNHVAPDHPWIGKHPEYFIRGDSNDAKNDPSSFIEINGTVFACGRDPYFPAWPDVLQLNAFDPGLRQAVIETLAGIACQCDGVRCDMAMLFLNAVFDRTWGARSGPQPSTEYWTDVISIVKAGHPGFLFIAEAYWDLEWELQQRGFDFCYDKKLYDRLEHSDAEDVRLHLCADMAYQNKLLRFIENHDEPRAAAIFSDAKLRAVELATATLPGLRLFHEGQFEGRKVRVPVFLGRRPDETVDEGLLRFSKQLMAAANQPVFRSGDWDLCARTGWPDNQSFRNLVAWTWRKDEERYLIAVNLSGSSVQAEIQLPWADLAGAEWRLHDMLSGAAYDRDGNLMLSPGLYVELQPWGFHFLQFAPAK
ncbi:alpha-amylase family glycosyl hydrolase [Alloacidobacterium sp.]|uniref:alpha-amylase family glycosyl hydrolase n=1 Tax=Alloacidobacterium sp. TaxID=2951999 RepID=UPI002D68EA83|nr:alpha-amylase family glycosyl hydrolase [Alloacidobacterium sp.]HYK36503.1 alpha-amylase family glycosyl hydrolase [Alloacidobacterium sp.]